MDGRKITLLGTGLIGQFYIQSIHQNRSADRVVCVYSRTEEHARKFATQWSVPNFTTDLEEAIQHPDSSVIIIGLPNFLHKRAIEIAVRNRKAILCTKPLAMNGQEALDILNLVEEANLFHGYLEDLCYPPKTIKALSSVQKGQIGQVLWTRSREAHPGPHSDWFWDQMQSGGGAIIDMGCHCIEIGRNYIGKNVRPVEVMCWMDTLVKPINAEDNAIALVRYETGAISQVEVSWTFRGGMELKDEVAGTEGTIRIDHWLRTGFEMFSSGRTQGYVAEKAEVDQGWLFPVGDEIHALGYQHMFADMFNALDQGTQPMETFYDGYVVNCIMDACYASAKSKKWEPVELPIWHATNEPVEKVGPVSYDDNHWLLKRELMPSGQEKVILKEKNSGEVKQLIINE